MRRVLLRSILTGTLAAILFAGTALGHECFVASRSDTGDIAAGSHSKVWFTIAETGGLFTFVGELLEFDPLTESQLDWAVEQAHVAGMPNQFTLFVGSKTIAEGTPAMDKNSADGKGIDHVFDWLPVVVGIYIDALQQ